jgi:hypothetical protein
MHVACMKMMRHTHLAKKVMEARLRELGWLVGGHPAHLSLMPTRSGAIAVCLVCRARFLARSGAAVVVTVSCML